MKKRHKKNQQKKTKQKQNQTNLTVDKAEKGDKSEKYVHIIFDSFIVFMLYQNIHVVTNYKVEIVYIVLKYLNKQNTLLATYTNTKYLLVKTILLFTDKFEEKKKK